MVIWLLYALCMHFICLRCLKRLHVKINLLHVYCYTVYVLYNHVAGESPPSWLVTDFFALSTMILSPVTNDAGYLVTSIYYWHQIHLLHKVTAGNTHSMCRQFIVETVQTHSGFQIVGWNQKTMQTWGEQSNFSCELSVITTQPMLHLFVHVWIIDVWLPLIQELGGVKFRQHDVILYHASLRFLSNGSKIT